MNNQESIKNITGSSQQQQQEHDELVNSEIHSPQPTVTNKEKLELTGMDNTKQESKYKDNDNDAGKDTHNSRNNQAMSHTEEITMKSM